MSKKYVKMLADSKTTFTPNAECYEVQAKKYHCYFVEHSISKGNNQGTKKNGILCFRFYAQLRTRLLFSGTEIPNSEFRIPNSNSKPRL